MQAFDLAVPLEKVRESKRALRVSAGCDGGELIPVGFPGVEQCPDAE